MQEWRRRSEKEGTLLGRKRMVRERGRGEDGEEVEKKKGTFHGEVEKKGRMEKVQPLNR